MDVGWESVLWWLSVFALAYAVGSCALRWRSLPTVRRGTRETIKAYYAGTVLEMHHDSAERVLALQTKERCWTVFMPHDPRIIATVDADVVRHVLVDNFANYDKGPQWRNAFRELLGGGIFNADGTEWRTQRKVASHVFSARALREFMSRVFERHTSAVAASVRRELGTVIDVQSLFARYTLDSIGEIGFGVEFGADAADFAEAFDVATKLAGERFIDPLWKLKRAFGVGQERVLAGALRRLESFSLGVIATRRATSSSDLEQRPDILSRYMRDASNFSDEQLRDVVVNFLLAGRDTTAVLLTWTMYELSQNPEVVAKLRAERGRVCAESLHQFVNDAPYLKATLTEVLRLHPSVPTDLKMANEDDVLPDGTEIRRGERVMYVAWSMGRQEALWPEPLRFDPSRHLRLDPEHGERFNAPESHKFPAFHAGPRLCLGKNVAYLSAGITLTSLLDSFDFELASPQNEPKNDNGLTLWVKGGLDLRFRRRAAAC